MPRSLDAERHLGDAREALERGALAIAGREAWSAASSAARIGDQAALREVLGVAAALATAGLRDAEQLRVYTEACLEDAEKGTRPPSALERLFSRDRRPR